LTREKKMSATYLVDISGNLAESLQEERENPDPLRQWVHAWYLVEKVPGFDSPDPDGGFARWKVYDEAADPSFEGKLVDPSLRQDYDESTGMVTLTVFNRTVRE
jgi:hypothetical protein